MKENLGWVEGQHKACGFVRLGTYLIPGTNDRLPYKGVQPFHVFVFLPLEQQPWKSMYAWMAKATNSPFAENVWLSAAGPVVGILNPDLIRDFPDVDTGTTILVITPDTLEFTTPSTVREPKVAARTVSAAPTTPSKGHRGRSRNPYSSPMNDQSTIAVSILTSPTATIHDTPASGAPDNISTTPEAAGTPSLLTNGMTFLSLGLNVLTNAPLVDEPASGPSSKRPASERSESPTGRRTAKRQKAAR